MPREPNDGLYPSIKAIKDISESEVAELVQQNKFSVLHQLIDLNQNTSMTNTLIRSLTSYENKRIKSDCKIDSLIN